LAAVGTQGAVMTLLCCA